MSDDMQSTIGKSDAPTSIFGFDPENFSSPVTLTRPPGNIDIAIDEMKIHLQAAVSLELSTIPLYLYAAYSIVNPGPATRSILVVVEQEMLHLALAGNLLCSIGGTPILYRKTGTHAYIPEYPTNMAYQDITLSLKAATKSNIRTFMELERPEPGLELEYDILSHSGDHIYGSIGAFYKAIELELVRINGSKSPFDAKSEDRQFKYADGSWYARDMTAVTDIKSAQAAIQTIVEQGEGSRRPPRSPIVPSRELPVEPTPPLMIKSHFEIFEELYRGTPLKCYKLLENPKTEKLRGNKYHPVLLFCDAVYCYLLITIEKMWDQQFEGDRHDLVTNNLHNIMLHVLRPLASFLVEKTYTEGNDTWNLAPFFNFFEFKATPSRHKQLKSECEKAVAVDSKLQSLQSVVDGFIAV